MLKKKKTAG